MTQEKLSENQQTIMIKGVEFVEQTDEDGQRYYQLVYPDGTIDSTELSVVYAGGNEPENVVSHEQNQNLTLGQTKQTKIEVMIDDDGVHEDW